MYHLLFYLVILLSNVIQGITGFAGTILAMPFSLRLVGMDTAVPVLNVLGMVSGIYVVLGDPKSVDRKELKRVLIFMIPALIAGLAIRTLLSGNPALLYRILGTIVLLIAIKGLYGMFAPGAREGRAPAGSAAAGPAFLISSGLVHGMFVCGGPLLIGYLAERIRDKARFRATISAVWIILNGIMLAVQIAAGQWTLGLLKVQLISLPFLFAGMYIGSLLFRRMDQRFFMILTYILLLISAVTLFFK